MNEQPIRIAHFALTALPRTVGGLEVVVDNLIRRQRAKGHDARLVTRWRQAGSARDLGVPYPVHALPPAPRRHGTPFREVGFRWPTASAIAWAQRRHRFDLWHAHWIYPTAWFAESILNSMSVPLVATAHGADIDIDADDGHGFRQFARNDDRVRDLVPRLSAITAVSPALAGTIEGLGAPRAAVSVISNGVDLRRFAASASTTDEVRSRVGVPEGHQLIVTVGSSRPAKGHKFIRPAFDALVRAGHDIVWVVLGGDPNTIAGAETEPAVGSAIRVLPATRISTADQEMPAGEVIDLYRAADVVAVPSVSEGFGLAALEAMAAGTPLVASDIPALRVLVKDGDNGLLVAKGDPEAIAAGIERVISNSALGHRLTAGGLATAKDHDLDRITDQYLSVYRHTIEGVPA